MNLSPSFDPAALDDPDALYYAALDYEPVAEPHALYVLPFCGLPDPTRLPLWDPAIDLAWALPVPLRCAALPGMAGPRVPARRAGAVRSDGLPLRRPEGAVRARL